ncbi:MAG: serine hydrolase [Pseudomonadota bacterium]
MRQFAFCAVLAALAGCSTDAPEETASADAGAPVGQETQIYSAEDEALYQLRYERITNPEARGGLGLGGYDTMEDVPGSAKYTPLAQGEAPAISADALAKVEDYAAANNSLAFIVWKDGKVISENYYGDTTRESLIISRSLAKPVTALAVGRAIALGKIKSLDQPASDFITEWKGTEREAILVRHLLDQRSGFLKQGMALEPENILNRAYLHPRHDEIIINDMTMTYTPGQDYEYANATSEMVAPVIERATGQRYAEFVSQEVIQKIGGQGGQVWVNRPGGTAHSGCCILLPAEDFLRMAIVVLQDGMWEGERLLPEGYVAQMRTGTDQNQYYGAGLWLPGEYTERRGYANQRYKIGQVLHSEPYLDKDMMMFDGNSNQIVYMIPSANLIALRVGNRPPKDPEWDNTVIPNTLIRGTQFAENAAPTPQTMPIQ